ncbi:MAG: hypothetical protein MST01_09660, partial [Prevotella sp.]|nr:hypothetical protein [Prevotella sp.]
MDILPKGIVVAEYATNNQNTAVTIRGKNKIINYTARMDKTYSGGLMYKQTMKQKFTHYFKSIILAIAFLLSGTMQTFSQQLCIYDQHGNKISFETSINKVGLSSCEYFYLAVLDANDWPAEYYYPQSSSEDTISITTTATTYYLSSS